ncbi:hypothetical protein HPB49_012197 [Dermacentor silvarum]|uniref:Uncharacterized protein n=1 Tax=Dermacentor silvarum TaxID=543639 RepID=A0ACB8E0B2_DERSI|nr:hypothetical protein HPB49_012197 [Dermacentor silvarum]
MELYVDANLRAFDLSIEHRKEINDTITLQATQALEVHNVGGVKCAIITAEKDVLEKCHLKRTWMSPNSAIRNALGGDVSRKPMVYRHIPPLVKQWRRPIIIARHAFSDQYNGQDFVVPGPGTLQIKYSPTVGASYNIHLWHSILEEHNAVPSSPRNQHHLQFWQPIFEEHNTVPSSARNQHLLQVQQLRDRRHSGQPASRALAAGTLVPRTPSSTLDSAILRTLPRTSRLAGPLASFTPGARNCCPPGSNAARSRLVPPCSVHPFTSSQSLGGRSDPPAAPRGTYI